MKTPTPRKLKSGNWNVQVLVNGKRVSVTAQTRSECERQALSLKLSAPNRGREPKNNPKALTIGKIVDRYIDDRKNTLSPSTIEGYKQIRRNRFKSVMDMKFESVNNWQRIVNAEAEKVKPKTLANAWMLMVSSFRAAGLKIDGEVTLSTPAINERPFLMPGQIPLFLKAIKDTDCEMGALLGLHSLRRSELINIRRKDVDLERKRIHVNGARLQVPGGYVEREQNKTPQSNRYVPIMSQRLMALVAGIEDMDAYLVQIAPNTLYRQINELCEVNGLPRIGVHGLRHSFASLCYKNHIDEWRVAQIGGWKDTDTIHKHYAHFRALYDASFSDGMDNLIDG